MEQNNNFDKWDRLLSKYVSVWIWSIVLGSSAGITYSLPRPQEFFDYGTFGLALLMIYSLIAALSLMSLILLLRFFRAYIFYDVLMAEQTEKKNLSADKVAIILNSAVSFLVMAIALRIMLGIMMAFLTLSLS